MDRVQPLAAHFTRFGKDTDGRAAKDRKVGTILKRHSQMLRSARMTGSVKLRRSGDLWSEPQQWAQSAD
jgi:hypothetical protein